MLLLLLTLGCGHTPPPPPPVPASTTPRLATLPVPGPYASVAHDIMGVQIALNPSLAADTGLLDDAVAVPSYAPEVVATHLAHLDQDMDTLRALDWDDLSVDQRIDVRWLFAQAQTLDHSLRLERRWEHRPAEWIEPLGYTLVAFATMAPDRPDRLQQVAARVPGMVDQMRALVIAPTARDITTADDLIDGVVQVLQTLPQGTERDAAVSALLGYQADIRSLSDLPEYRVIGPEAYAWRLQHTMLLPWSADELLAQAQAELDRVDAELATIELPPPSPATDEERALAQDFSRDTLLSLYDEAVEQNLAALRQMDIISVPEDLPPIRARETPEAAVPLTGDGGSMNPPPLFGPRGVGHWNVQHYREDWPLEQRLDMVLTARRQARRWFGYYAAHEGVPGHHLQLAMARTIENPVRTLLTDGPSVEGWALYAEQLFWEGGVACTARTGQPCGFGDTPAARSNMLRSYRARIRRVFYDVNTETGRWTLQEASNWRASKPGAPVTGAPVGRDVLRAIQWPTQLISYFAGKKQILDLRAEVGDRMTTREFNDTLLAQGQIPIALIRARMLGLPVPGLPGE